MNKKLIKYITSFICKILAKDKSIAGIIVYTFHPYSTEHDYGTIGNMFSNTKPAYKYLCNHTLKQMIKDRAAEDY